MVQLLTHRTAEAVHQQFAEKQKVQYPIYLTADLFATLRYPR